MQKTFGLNDFLHDFIKNAFFIDNVNVTVNVLEDGVSVAIYIFCLAFLLDRKEEKTLIIEEDLQEELRYSFYRSD